MDPTKISQNNLDDSNQNDNDTSTTSVTQTPTAPANDTGGIDQQYNEILKKYAAQLNSPELDEPEKDSAQSNPSQIIEETDLISAVMTETTKPTPTLVEPTIEPTLEPKIINVPAESEEPITPPPHIPSPKFASLSQTENETKISPLDAKLPPISPAVNLKSQDTQQKLNQILNDSDSPKNHGSGFFKYLFFLSLVIFLGVVGAIAYTVLKPSAPPMVENTTNTPLPTAVPNLCEVNDKTYGIGESFAASDGCNTCRCGDNLTITCSENSCDQQNQAATSSATLGLWKKLSTKPEKYQLDNKCLTVTVERIPSTTQPLTEYLTERYKDLKANSSTIQYVSAAKNEIYSITPQGIGEVVNVYQKTKANVILSTFSAPAPEVSENELTKMCKTFSPKTDIQNFLDTTLK